MLTSYPRVLDSEALIGTVAIVMSGRTLSQAKQLHSFLWNVEGYFAGLTLGDPTLELPAYACCFEAPAEEPDFDQMLDFSMGLGKARGHLCEHVAQMQTHGHLLAKDGAAVPHVGIDPATIMLIISLIDRVLPDLLKWLQDRKKRIPQTDPPAAV